MKCTIRTSIWSLPALTTVHQRLMNRVAQQTMTRPERSAVDGSRVRRSGLAFRSQGLTAATSQRPGPVLRLLVVVQQQAFINDALERAFHVQGGIHIHTMPAHRAQNPMNASLLGIPREFLGDGPDYRAYFLPAFLTTNTFHFSSHPTSCGGNAGA